MRLNALFRVFFVVYCVEAGLFLVLAPWSSGWDRAVLHIPIAVLRSLFLLPVLRGAMSGFGLIHLLWSVHDVEEIIVRWKLRAGVSS